MKTKLRRILPLLVTSVAGCGGDPTGMTNPPPTDSQFSFCEFEQTCCGVTEHTGQIMSGMLVIGQSGPMAYIGSDGKRHIFPSIYEFVSWFGADEDGTVRELDPALCGMVINAPQMKLEHTPIGEPVTIRPGTYVIGSHSDANKRWLVSGHHMLHEATHEVVYAFYGPESGRAVHHLDDPLVTSYVLGGPLLSAADYDRAAALRVTLEQDLGLEP